MEASRKRQRAEPSHGGLAKKIRPGRKRALREAKQTPRRPARAGSETVVKNQASRAAVRADAKVESPGAKKHVSEADHAQVVSLLQMVDWASVVNTGRKNVIDPAKAPKDSRGKPFCHSFILGPNMKDPERRPSYWTEQNPLLWDKLRQLMQAYDPEHAFTNITVNKNFRCKPHRDRGNTGKSYIIAFGDYSGGELCVGPREKNASGPAALAPRKYAKLDLHCRFEAFYGCEQTHWVSDFEGERFTCVFYNFPDVHEKGRRAHGVALAPRPESAPPGATALANKLEQFKAKLGRRR